MHMRQKKTQEGLSIPSGSNSTKYGRGGGVKKSNAATYVLCATALAVVFVAGAGVYTFTASYIQRQGKVIREQVEQEMMIKYNLLEQNLTDSYSERDELDYKIRQLQKGANKVDSALQKMDTQSEQITTMEKRIQRLTAYKAKAKQRIQQLSMIHLLRQFGPGPHYVEIKVAFDPASNVADDTEGGGNDTFLIQMAPVREMPHAVYWFLEQVRLGLFVGASFHRNAGHVVQGGPARNFMTPPNAGLVKRFKDTGYDSILFQEYSEKFPHKKYTLGYAGRPGGPDFYVSTLDNTRNHGPGGQGSYADASEADPCFAKVISGFDTVDRMHRSATKPGGYKAMEHNVAIVNMTWYTDNTDPVPPILKS